MHVLLTKNFLANYQEKDSKWLGVFPTQSNFLALISKSFSLPYTTCVTEVFENAVFSVGVVWTLPNNNKIMYILEILRLRKMRPPFYELEKYDFSLLLCSRNYYNQNSSTEITTIDDINKNVVADNVEKAPESHSTTVYALRNSSSKYLV